MPTATTLQTGAVHPHVPLERMDSSVCWLHHPEGAPPSRYRCHLGWLEVWYWQHPSCNQVNWVDWRPSAILYACLGPFSNFHGTSIIWSRLATVSTVPKILILYWGTNTDFPALWSKLLTSHVMDSSFICSTSSILPDSVLSKASISPRTLPLPSPMLAAVRGFDLARSELVKTATALTVESVPVVST